jgi:hypothetical protein
LPWGCYQGGATACVGGLPDYFIIRQQRSLFIAWPMAITMILSANFFVSIFLSKVEYFSKLGYFTLAWPLVDFLPLSFFSLFYIFCLPIGFILAIATSIICLRRRKHFGDLLTVVWSMAWIYLAFYYGDITWSLSAD